MLSSHIHIYHRSQKSLKGWKKHHSSFLQSSVFSNVRNTFSSRNIINPSCREDRILDHQSNHHFRIREKNINYSTKKERRWNNIASKSVFPAEPEYRKPPISEWSTTAEGKVVPLLCGKAFYLKREHSVCEVSFNN